jgi:hypothetical protein
MIKDLIFFQISLCIIFSMTVLIACSENSTIRICEPTLSQGCPKNKRCTLNDSSKPVCRSIADPTNAKGIDESCEQAEDCLSGLGCIRRFGVKVCAQFCTKDEDLKVTYSCQNGSQESKDWIAEQSELRQTIVELQLCALQTIRPDISLCIAPCVPGADTFAAGGCEDHQNNNAEAHLFNCNFSRALPFTVCMENGTAQLGETCGIQEQCVFPNACMQNFDVKQCMLLEEDDHECPPYHLLRFASGKRNPINGSLYGSCWQDIGLPIVAKDKRYRITLESKGITQNQILERFDAQIQSIRSYCEHGMIASPAQPATLEFILDESRKVFDEINYINQQRQQEIAEIKQSDMAVADMVVSDMVVSDMVVADMVVADMAVADMAVSDMAVSDMAVSDMAVSDMAVSDMAVSDMAVSDMFNQMETNTYDNQWLRNDKQNLWISTRRILNLPSDSSLRDGWLWDNQDVILAEQIDIHPLLLTDSNMITDPNQLCLSINVITQRFLLRACSDQLPVLCVSEVLTL